MGLSSIFHRSMRFLLLLPLSHSLFPAKFHALFFRACNCSFRSHFFIFFITRYPTIMIKFRHRVLDTSREIMDAVAAFAGTCSSKCMRPLLYHEQSWGSVQKNATSSLLNTSAASVVTLEVAGLLSALLWMNTDTLVHVVARQSEMLSFSTKLHICLADLCGYRVTIWPVVICNFSRLGPTSWLIGYWEGL